MSALAVPSDAAKARRAARWRTPAGRLSRSSTLGLGLALVGLAMLIGANSGAYPITPAQLLSMLAKAIEGTPQAGPEQLVFFNIRLPRLLLGVAAGAGLWIAVAMM